MVRHRETKHPREAEPAEPVAPEVTGDDRWENEGPERQQVEIHFMLQLDKFVLFQVRNICRTIAEIGLEYHPAQMVPPETSGGVVGVQVRVSVAVVRTMTSGPEVG